MTTTMRDATLDKMLILKESLKDVFSSIVGSAACVYTGQPFDTVKVRMQVQPGVFSSSIECFRKTMLGEGISTLWRGSVPALIGALSENTVAFTINGNLKRLMELTRKESGTPSNIEPFLSGGLTGFCTAFVLCPSDVLKCRAQLSRSQGVSMGFREILSVTLQKQGDLLIVTANSQACQWFYRSYCLHYSTQYCGNYSLDDITMMSLCVHLFLHCSQVTVIHVPPPHRHNKKHWKLCYRQSISYSFHASMLLAHSLEEVVMKNCWT